MVLYPRSNSFRTGYSWGASGEPLCEVGHQGLMHDEEFGLIYNRARMLHPTLGRFVQRDPLGYVDGMNVYRYCQNSPIDLLDPSGLVHIAMSETISRGVWNKAFYDFDWSVDVWCVGNQPNFSNFSVGEGNLRGELDAIGLSFAIIIGVELAQTGLMLDHEFSGSARGCGSKDPTGAIQTLRFKFIV